MRKTARQASSPNIRTMSQENVFTELPSSGVLLVSLKSSQ